MASPVQKNKRSSSQRLKIMLSLKGLRGRWFMSRKRAVNLFSGYSPQQILQLFTMLVLYHDKVTAWKKSSLNHTNLKPNKEQLAQPKPGRWMGGTGAHICIRRRKPGLFGERQYSGGYALLRAELCDNEATQKGTGCSNPASSSSTTEARICRLVSKHYQPAWKQQKYHTQHIGPLQ